jgi:uncharacterized membrane protein YkgB
MVGAEVTTAAACRTDARKGTGVVSVGQFAALLGVVGTGRGVLIAILPVWLLGSATGSGLAAVMFLTTLTFLINTPG